MELSKFPVEDSPPSRVQAEKSFPHAQSLPSGKVWESKNYLSLKVHPQGIPGLSLPKREYIAEVPVRKSVTEFWNFFVTMAKSYHTICRSSLLHAVVSLKHWA